jgi:hypothetical protein
LGYEDAAFSSLLEKLQQFVAVIANETLSICLRGPLPGVFQGNLCCGALHSHTEMATLELYTEGSTLLVITSLFITTTYILWEM